VFRHVGLGGSGGGRRRDAATSPTVHAVLRRHHRLYSIEHTGCLLGDEIRDRWRRGDGDEVRLIWAYYRLVRGSEPPRTLLEWFRQERSLLREVNVALRVARYRSARVYACSCGRACCGAGSGAREGRAFPCAIGSGD